MIASIILIVCLSLMLVELVLGIRSLARATRIILRGSSVDNGDMPTEDPRLLILIPCLDEQVRIRSTLEAVCNEFSYIGASVVVVTCKREKPIDGVRTADIVTSFAVETGCDVAVCEYPGEGYMADQLNYALGVRQNAWDYCLIYNADSRPAPGTAKAFCDAMKQGYPVVQQYSTMTSNISSLNGLMKAFSLYQTNFELKVGYLGCLLPSVMTTPHVVGHGLLMSSKVFDGFEFTNEHWCEDIYLSFSLFNQGIDVHPLAVLEKCECPPSFQAQVVQHSTWFKTAFDVIGIAKTELKRHSLSLRGFRYLTIRFIRSLMWLISPLLIVLTFVVPAFIGRLELSFLSFISYLLMCALEYGSTVILLFSLDGDGVSFRDAVIGLAWIPLARLLSCIGPWRSFAVKEKQRTPQG